MKRNKHYNIIEIALIYYNLIGVIYDEENKLQRDLARNNFKTAKKAKTLKCDILEKAFQLYFQKIREDFE